MDCKSMNDGSIPSVYSTTFWWCDEARDCSMRFVIASLLKSGEVFFVQLGKVHGHVTPPERGIPEWAMPADNRFNVLWVGFCAQHAIAA